MKTLMIMAGGTGGHIFPGLAVAAALQTKGWQVCWLGNPQAMEGRLVPSHGYTLFPLNFSALRGKGVVRKLMLPLTLCRAVLQAFRILRQVQPDVVLGMGGYISFPGAVAAVLQRRALILHEQNSVAGLANRVLARVADITLSGFPQVLEGQWVGNPVRAEIERVAPPAERFTDRSGPLRIVVLGGSLGAAILNEIVPQALAQIATEQRPHVIHQAGRDRSAAVIERYYAAGVTAEVSDFIDDMVEPYHSADLVICRAGALTVAELSAVGVASILVPFPSAVDDHQTVNAQFLAQQDAAVLCPQPTLTPAHLARLIESLSREKLLAMAMAARALHRPDSAETVACICERLVGVTLAGTGDNDEA